MDSPTPAQETQRKPNFLEDQNRRLDDRRRRWILLCLIGILALCFALWHYLSTFQIG